MSGPTVTDMTTREPRVLVRAAAEVGEGPVASADGMIVHWVDIFAGAVHSTDLAGGLTSSIRVDTLVGAVALRQAGGFVAATREGFATISDEGALETVRPVLGDGERMNDASCDARGRFWAGSTAMDFTAGRGALHVLSPDWSTRRVLEGLTLPNGLGWSPDGATFYLVDSLRRRVSAFDFDAEHAELADERVLVEFAPELGLPDGLTVDDSGNLWVAMWGGSRILQICPEGTILGQLPLPVRQPSSCVFAGRLRDQLVVTSATQGLDLGPGEGTLDGSLLEIRGLGACGLPTKTFAA